MTEQEIIVQQKEEIEILSATVDEALENAALDLRNQTQLQLELTATQARVAMLVKALRVIRRVERDSGYQWVEEDSGRYLVDIIDEALSNSAEHTNKWLAEQKARLESKNAKLRPKGTDHE